MRIEHVALWCLDLEALANFYEAWFEARRGTEYQNPTKGFRSLFLSFPEGSRLELMQRTDITRRESREDLGYAHLAFGLGSEAAVDSLTQRMEAQGVRRLDGPRRTGDGYYESLFLDPEGNRIELTV